MVNTKMFVFKHPKYYKELRKRNKSDQAISSGDVITGDSTESQGVRLDPGLKLGEMDIASSKQQTSSESKPEPSSGSQASSDKPLSHKHRDQASSHKRQA